MAFGAIVQNWFGGHTWAAWQQARGSAAGLRDSRHQHPLLSDWLVYGSSVHLRMFKQLSQKRHPTHVSIVYEFVRFLCDMTCVAETWPKTQKKNSAPISSHQKQLT